jgi:hypothetical protein
MSGDKTENKSGRQDFGLLNSNCAQNLSAASNSQFVRVIPYNFLHQVELIIRGLDQLVLSPQNPSILNANASQSGQYICTISGTGGCDDKRPSCGKDSTFTNS